MSQYPALVAEPTWARMPSKFAFSILNGSTPSSSELSYWDGDIFWATPEDIGAMSGKVLRDTRRKITEAGYQNSGTRLAPPGSIVLTTRAPVGNLAIAGMPLCTNQGCKTLVPNDAVDASFAYSQLQARRNELEMLAAGTTFQELSSEKLSALELWLPPLADQRAIAAYLDQHTPRLDDLIAAKQYLLALLAEKCQALITHAVTRGLDSAAPRRDSGVPWLGEIPAHWEIVTIKHLASVGNGSTPLRENEVYWRDGDYPWLTSTVVNDDIVGEPSDWVTPTALRECHLPLVPPNSVVVAITGQGKTRGKAAILPYEATINQHLAYFSPQQDRLDSNYLDTHRTAIDELVEVTETTISLLQERRSALIAAAVTGQIDVTGA